MRVAAAAPSATILVSGYPPLITPQRACNGVGLPRSGFRSSAKIREQFEALRVRLNQAIAGAVEDAHVRGTNISYVSTTDYLRGHEICARSSWIIGLELVKQVIRNEKNLYHPNIFGRRALAQAVLEQGARRVRPDSGSTSATHPITFRVSPDQWDPNGSAWSNYGPSYEANPIIVLAGATHAHAYGSGTGQLSYTLDLPSLTGGTVTISARLSAEHAFYSAPSDQQSDVTLIVNGTNNATQRVIADNGSGQLYTWQARASDLRVGTNTITFAVRASSEKRNGLCIYGEALATGETDAYIELRNA